MVRKLPGKPPPRALPPHPGGDPGGTRGGPGGAANTFGAHRALKNQPFFNFFKNRFVDGLLFIFTSLLDPFFYDLSYFLHPFFETYLRMILFIFLYNFSSSYFWPNPRGHLFYCRNHMISVHSPFPKNTFFREHTFRKTKKNLSMSTSFAHQNS